LLQVGLISCPEEYYGARCVWVWSWSLEGKKEFAVLYRCAWENDSSEYLL